LRLLRFLGGFRKSIAACEQAAMGFMELIAERLVWQIPAREQAATLPLREKTRSFFQPPSIIDTLAPPATVRRGFRLLVSENSWRAPLDRRLRPGHDTEVNPKGRSVMAASYTAVIQQQGEWWIGWVEEVPGVNSQGHTREELLDNLRDALEEALEMNRAEARAAAKGAYEEVSISA
jgi:predicted RNase H-like HicB family nuclease